MRVLCRRKVIMSFVILYGSFILIYKTLTTSHIYESFLSKLIETKFKKSQFFMNSPIVNHLDGDLKYILLWRSSARVPFLYMGVGRRVFMERKCPYSNCIVTSNKSLLGDYTKFDVIAFYGPRIMFYSKLPAKRLPHQKFVYANIESSDYYPICTDRFDGYFNWTWTYRLDSEVKWGYIVIRDKNNTIVGPQKEMHWMKLTEMEPISDDLKIELRSKTIAVAWFTTNCITRSERESFVWYLQKQLKKYKLEIHIFGNCGPLKCPRDKDLLCDELVRDVYYFYLSFENALSEDYVTEKLLRPLQNNAIPIVYGGANYTRFMPDGIYLNARELGVEKLANKMHELINNPDKYSEYFKWKKYYSYHRQLESVETDEYCLFCKSLNDKEMINKTTIYKDFHKWWNPPNRCCNKIYKTMNENICNIKIGNT